MLTTNVICRILALQKLFMLVARSWAKVRFYISVTDFYRDKLPTAQTALSHLVRFLPGYQLICSHSASLFSFLFFIFMFYVYVLNGLLRRPIC